MPNDDKKTRYTEAQKKAIDKYRAEKVERIQVLVPKGEKDKIREHAAAHSESVNGFVYRAISETIERDNNS